MFGLAALFTLFAVGMGLLLVFALVVGIVKLVFRVALLPVALGIGLVKLIVLPIVALVLLFVVGPVLLAVGAVVLVPLLLLGGLLALAWAGLHLIAAV
jgi:hypothetical protein